MNCTLSVNTGACLSRRRVSTGVFTNQTCAVNRNRRKLFIMQIDRQPQTVRMNRWCPPKNKRDSQRTTASFGEGILLLMGCSQNYIMYWGVFTLIIVPFSHSKVCTNFTKVAHAFCALCIVPFSHFRKNLLFGFYSSVVSVTTSAPLWNNASNSSLPIFSFSKRRSADLWSTSLFS